MASPGKINRNIKGRETATPSPATNVGSILLDMEGAISATFANVFFGKKSGVKQFKQLLQLGGQEGFFAKQGKEKAKPTENKTDAKSNAKAAAVTESITHDLQAISLIIQHDMMQDIEKMSESLVSHKTTTSAYLSEINSNVLSINEKFENMSAQINSVAAVLAAKKPKEKPGNAKIDIVLKAAKGGDLKTFQKALDKLQNVDAKKISSLITAVKKIEKINVTNVKSLNKGINSVYELSETLKKIKFNSLKTLQKSIDELYELTKGKGKKNHTIPELFSSIAALETKSKKAKPGLTAINILFDAFIKMGEIKKLSPKKLKSVIDNLSNIINDIEILFKEIGEKDLKTNVESARANLQTINDFFEKDIKNTLNIVNSSGNDVNSIANALESSKEKIDEAAVKSEPSKTTNISFEGLGRTIMLAGATMLIGGLILMKNPKLIAESLKFGAVLMVFIAMTMAPMLMLKVFTSENQDLSATMQQFGTFIIKASLILLLGGLIFMWSGGKLVKHALKFGIVLGAFILIISLAVKPLRNLEGVDLKGLYKLVFVSTVIMLIGALFVENSKLMKNSLKFGLVLGAFLFIVLLPFKLMGGLLGGALKAANDVSKLVITCTVIMLIGALFLMLGGGKFVHSAIAFGIILGIFIVLVTLPIRLIFGKHRLTLAIGIKLLQSFLVTCTVLLFIGALFMQLKNGYYAKQALKFGVLMAEFIFVTLLPFIFFKRLLKQSWKTLISLTAFILVEGILLFIGADLVEDGKMASALKFTVMFSLFIAATLLPMRLISKGINHDLKTVGALALIIISLAFSMTILTDCVVKNGMGAMLEATIIMGISIGLTVAFIKLISKIPGIEDGVLNAALIGVAVGLLGVAFGIVATSMSKLSLKDMTKFLLGVGILALVFGIIGIEPIATAVGLGSLVAAAMGLGIMLLSKGFLVLHNTMEKTDPAKDFGKLNETLIVAGKTFGLLGLMSIGIILGSISAVAMSIALTTLTLSFKLLNWLVGSNSDINPSEDFGKLDAVLVRAGKTFQKLGKMIFGILFGSVAAVAMSVALTTLGLSFLILGKAVDETPILENFDKLNQSLESAGQTFKKLGKMIFGILAGSVSAVAMSVAFTTLGISFLILGKAVSETPILDHFEKLNQSLDAAGQVFNKLGKMIFGITFGSIAAVEMSIGLTKIGKAFGIVGEIASKYDNLAQIVEETFVGPGALIDITGKLFDKIGGVPMLISIKTASWSVGAMSKALVKISVAYAIAASVAENVRKAFPNGSDDFYELISILPKTMEKLVDNNPFKGLRIIGLYAYLESMYQISSVVGSIGNVVGRLAHYTILKFRPDGKIETIEVTPEEMKKAAITIMDIVSVLTTGFKNAAKLFDDDDLNERIELAMYMGANMSRVVGRLFDGLKSYAELSIPVWKNGEIVSRRPMNENDFKAAAEGVSLVFTKTLDALVYATTKLKSKEVRKRLDSAVKAAGGVGDVVSGIAEGLMSYAKLQVPIAWNKDGKPISFRKMKPGDFEQAGTNVSTIMTTLLFAIERIYNRNKEMFEDASSGFLGLGGKEEGTSPIATVIKATNGLGKLISDTGSGVQKFAAMSIPIYSPNKNGPVGYRSMTKQDFTDAAANVELIMTHMMRTVSNIYYGNPGLFTGNGAKKVIESSKEMGNVISSLADGIQKMAAGSIAIEWDKTGKPIKFRQLNAQDLALTKLAVSKITYGLVNAIGSVYYTDWSIDYLTGKMKGGKTPNPLFSKGDDSPIMIASNGINNATKIVSNMAKGLQDMANLRMPIAWDKEGKPTKYAKEFDFDKVSKDIGINIARISQCVVNAIGSVYFKDWASENPHTVNPLFNTTSGESAISKAIEGFTGIFDVVKTMIEIVQNTANLRIPIGPYDKDGKPKGYKVFDLDQDLPTLRNNIYMIVTALPLDLVFAYDQHKELFSEETSEKFTMITGTMSTITTVLESVAKMLESYSHLRIPVLGKDDKPKSYIDASGIVKDIESGKIQKQLVSMIVSIPMTIAGILDYKDANGTAFVDILKTIESNEESIIGGFGTINSIISSVIPILQEIGNSKKELNNLKQDKNGLFPDVEKLKFIIIDLNGIIDVINKTHVSPVTEVYTRNFSKFSIEFNRMLIKFSYMLSSMMQLSMKPYFINYNVYSEKTYQTLYRMLDDINTMSLVMNGIMRPRRGNWYKWRGISSIHPLSTRTVVNYLKALKGYSVILKQSYNFLKSIGDIDLKYLQTFRDSYRIDLILLAINEISKLSLYFGNRHNLFGIKLKRSNRAIIEFIGTINGIGILIDNINTISPKIAAFDIQIGMWRNKLEKLHEMSDMISEIFIPKQYSDSIVNAYMLMKDEINYYSRKSNMIFNIINRLIKATKVAENVSEEGMLHVRLGIEELDRSLGNVDEKNIKKFEKENENLEKYVKTINMVDVSKVNSMSSLMQRLTEFMYTVGDMPKFTEALADRLSTGLVGVAEQTKYAADVINKADKLQERREKAIQNSMSKINNVFGKTLKIEVGRTDDGNTKANYLGNPGDAGQKVKDKGEDEGKGNQPNP